MRNKRKLIIGIISIIIIIILSIIGYKTYKNYQINNLVHITEQFFNEYVKKCESSYKEQNMKATYKNNEIVIVAGDKKEFVGMVYYEVDIDVNGEKDYSSSYHKMRIKKDNKGSYKLIEEGNQVNFIMK